ncbi:MAG TPA: acyl-ACP--UDP-N-acetylglucosamine O-acyltransferase [Candidatus Cloacimonadota bacterium]|mgnify:CR=1 FL=1|nr:acyl-ACP--UDP-N-acetylglucosamine O-acyltransferase [Candidatus Cloacimonadota bacterium]
MSQIHPTAIVHPSAEIGDDCVIGPWCYVGPKVKLGRGNHLIASVTVDGNTTLGDENRIFSHAVIGTEPQDLKYAGEDTRLVIGSRNLIREFVAINTSTDMEEDTVVGDNNLLMEYVHVAHNCQVGSNCVIANMVQLAGHVHVHDFAIIGGMTGVHQFVHIGTHCFVGGASAVKKDIAPYTRGEGNPYQTIGLNSTGLMRKGYSSETVEAIKQVYNLFYRKGLNVSQALAAAEALENLIPEQRVFIDFVKNADRGLSN